MHFLDIKSLEKYSCTSKGVVYLCRHLMRVNAPWKFNQTGYHRNGKTNKKRRDANDSNFPTEL